MVFISIKMEIGGLQKITLIDYPGKIATTVFTIGCNLLCPFCYAPNLVLPGRIKNQSSIALADFFDFLEKKKGLLDGVVICGGEPTIHSDLPQFIQEIKKLGFCVKLDTNGFRPWILRDLIANKLIDYIAMDIKAPKEKYRFYSGTVNDIADIDKSIDLLRKGEVDYEFRTTVAPGILRADILNIVQWIKPAKSYFLQEVDLEKEMINPDIKDLSLIPREELQKIIVEIKTSFEHCQLR